MAANAGTAAVLAAEVRRPTANPVHSSGEPTGTAGAPSAAGSTGIPAGALTIPDTGAAATGSGVARDRWGAGLGLVLPMARAGAVPRVGDAAEAAPRPSALPPSTAADGASDPAEGDSAQAIAEPLKAAAPTPRATAKPPTRPM